MERIYQKVSNLKSSSLNRDDDTQNSKQRRVEINLNDLEADPSLRKKITRYHPNDLNNIRRAYWQKGPCQPKSHNFLFTQFGNKSWRFNPSWFSKFGAWLEYNITKDSAYCMCCYLFKPDIGEQSGGDSVVGEGFRNWKKKDKLSAHIGSPNSAHNHAMSKCRDLVNQNQHIETVLFKQLSQARVNYRARLNASIDCIRYLLRQGLPLRGHNESDVSSNRGNFLKLLQFLADHNEGIEAVVLKNAPENLKLTSPDIQRDIVNVAATETVNAIINAIGDEFFSILVDESRDVSTKEQMAVALRYVNGKGNLIECFLGIEHVSSTSALSLKTTIDALFSRHGLSISRLHGQGYDGASNMQGEFNGLKALIMKENECAFYVHCFAHQLQLALIDVSKNHFDISWFFNSVTSIVIVVGASCKRRDAL